MKRDDQIAALVMRDKSFMTEQRMMVLRILWWFQKEVVLSLRPLFRRKFIDSRCK